MSKFIKVRLYMTESLTLMVQLICISL